MPDVVVFCGVTFTRYPNAKSLSGRRYYYPDKRLRKDGIGALHQEVWKRHHGPIPEGMHIHHKDGDTLNNTIDNLECISAGEHTLRHAGSTPARRLAAAAARPLTVSWHGSPAGIEWHRAHGKESWENRQPEVRVCAECGKGYECWSLRDTDKWCSGACRQRHHYRFRIGWVKKECLICGGVFHSQSRGRFKTCSRSCGVRLQHKEARERRAKKG